MEKSNEEKHKLSAGTIILSIIVVAVSFGFGYLVGSRLF